MGASFKGKVPLPVACEHARRLCSFLLASGFRQVEVCGSVRRAKPEVGDLDLVVAGELDWLREPACPWRYVDGGDRKATIEFQGMQVNIVRAEPEEWGAALLYFTGPQQYNIAYRARAKRMGLKLNEHGLWRGEHRVAGRTEEEVYQALGKEWKEPAMRGAR